MTVRVRKSWTLPVFALAALALMVVVAGCGGGSSSSSSEASTTPSSEPKGEEGGGSSASSAVTEAEEFVAEAKEEPEFPSLAPLAKPPAAGKTAVYIRSGPPNTATLGEYFEKAAKAAGWQAKVLDSMGTPEGIENAWTTAQRMKPDVLVWDGLPRAVVEKYLKPLEEDGTVLIGDGIPDPVGNGISAVVTGTADFELRGQWMARWVVADSGGDAHVAFFSFPAPVIETVQSSFEAELEKLCPECTIKVQQISEANIGTKAPAEMVNVLSGNPDINYVVGGFGDITTGLPQALSTAGLSERVKIVNQAGFAALQNVAEGTEAVNVPEPAGMLGWLWVDAGIRAINGEKLDQESYDVVPHIILEQEGAEALNGEPWGPSNFEAEFEKLWEGK